MDVALQGASELYEELEQFAWKIAHVYARKLPAYGVNDFFGDGIVGLCVAADRYKDKPWEEQVSLAKETIKNHIKKSFARQYWPKKARPEGHFIDLTEVAEKVGFDAFAEVYAMEYFQHVNEMLSEFAKIVFSIYASPPKEIIDRISIKNARKLHLREQGHTVRMATMSAGEVADFLQVSRAQVDSCMVEIRSALNSTKHLISLRG